MTLILWLLGGAIVAVAVLIACLPLGAKKLETPQLRCDRCHRWRSVKTLVWGDDGPHCDGGCK